MEDWLEHKQDLANIATANLKIVCERELTRRNRTRQPASFRVGNLVLVHHSGLPTSAATVCRTFSLGLMVL